MKSLVHPLFFFLLTTQICFGQWVWTKYEGNPVLTGSGSNTWDKHVMGPWVIFNADSNRYEMFFFASMDDWGPEPPYKIGMAYSTDKINWTKHPDPIISPTPGFWDAGGAYHPCVIREDSVYKMWYMALKDSWYPIRICYAVSTDGGLTWTKHPDPVLTPGTAQWESYGVAVPLVLKEAEGYVMYYSGMSPAGIITKIGRAISADGINWQRDTVHSPVLSAGTGWEAKIFASAIVNVEDIYYLYYCGYTYSSPGGAGGLALSTDGGLTFQKTNKVISTSSSGWDNYLIENDCVIYEDSTFYMWYAGSSNPYLLKIGLATSPFTSPLLPGIYTVGTGGSFATIQEAFNKLETNGVAGNVTLELIDELYNAPAVQYGFSLDGPITGAGPDRRVTIRPADNKNVTIQGSSESVLYLVNTSYVTFDGIGTTGPTTLTIHALQNSSFDYNDGIDFINNSDHNIIQNIIFIIEDNTRASGTGFWYNQTGAFAPDNNLIQRNFCKKAGLAFFIVSPTSTTRGKGNVIRENRIGSLIDSLVTYGIQVTHGENTIIENNIIQNLKATISGSDQLTAGIVSVIGSGDIIRNNVISNLRGISGFTSSGIFLHGLSGNVGNYNSVYNNMIYDINSISTQSNSRVAGIQMQYQNNPKIYYNSVYLSGTGANKLGSAALYIYSGVSNADLKNNILVNTRDESPYCASAIYDHSASNLTSDYNDLYYDNTNNNNCLVRIGTTNYNSLAAWHAAGKDMHSITEMPNFILPHLHISASVPTYLEGRATKILGYGSDIDGDVRHSTNPDIGADEFNGIPIVGVEDNPEIPTEFALGQNYPNPFNPNTKIKWQSPVSCHQTIKVFDVLGNEIITVVDEYKPAGKYEIEFDASNLPSGVYFYQLRAGDYILVKKMLLLR